MKINIKNHFKTPNALLLAIIIVLILYGLCFVYSHSLTLFHNLIEFFSVSITAGIFIVTWNSRKFIKNNYLRFIGITFLFVASLEFLYTIYFTHISSLTESNNFALQLWIASGCVQAVSFVAAPFFLNRKIKVSLILASFSFITCFFLLPLLLKSDLLIHFQIGDNLFRISTECIICLLLIISLIYFFLKNHNEINGPTLYLIIHSIVILTLAELFISLATNPESPFETVGYVCKLLSFYLMYKAINKTLIEEPNILLNESKEALKDSKSLFRAIFESNAIGVILINEKGQILDSNLTLEKMLGYEKMELQNMIFSEFTYQEDRGPDMVLFRELFNAKCDNYQIEQRFIRKDGQTFWGRLSVSNLTDSDGKTKFGVGIIEDIIMRKCIEEELDAERERLAVTLSSIGDGVIATDKLGEILLLNSAAEKLTGWKRKYAINQPLQKIFYIYDEKTDEPYENLVEIILKNNETVYLNHVVLVTKDMAEINIAISGARIRDENGKDIGVVLVFHNITEKRKMEEELIKAQKMESLGILAGGIAHDFNNILAAILANIQLAIVLSKKGKDILRYLNETVDATHRATELTTQLLTFSKGGAPVRKSASISDLIRDTVRFTLRGSRVKCNFYLPDNLRGVEIDGGQISQVINNLIINAEQAMPQGGLIEVSAENIVSEKVDIFPLKPGNYIKITIKDHGSGIPKENFQKIFDPFFTTKKEGNGLGLATSYSIIKNHYGYIDLESKVGVGTTFYIYLPANQDIFKKSENKTESFLNGEGKILLMDDEDIFRNVVGEMLTCIGYRVKLAKDGAEAIELYRQDKESGDPFDAVIMDLTIPGGIGGQEAIKSLIKIDPQVKAIVSSGYSNDPVMANFEKYGFCGVITKPYRYTELVEVLNKVISKDQLKLPLE